MSLVALVEWIPAAKRPFDGLSITGGFGCGLIGDDIRIRLHVRCEEA